MYFSTHRKQLRAAGFAIIDNNGVQSWGKLEAISGLVHLREKWESFGWYVVELDGHNMEQLTVTLENAALRGRATREKRKGLSIVSGQAPPNPDQPVVIIAHTIKGKGVPFMEGNNVWHKRVPSDEEHQLAMSILGGLDLE